MIRIVCYLVPDAGMQHAQSSRWFVDWLSPPNLSSSAALKRAATRMATWEQRLARGSYNGVTRVALEAVGSIVDKDAAEHGSEEVIRVLEIAAPTGDK
jgi:hypothetical protein